MATTAMENGNQYHSSKLWQIGLFTLNNTATNLYLFILGFVTYYATGVAGLLVVGVSVILTGSRIFDSITDPIVGFILDKTESRFGKFRPFMIIGNITLASSVLLMYNVTHLLPESLRLIFFIASYILYIIGYTLQTSTTKAAQTVLTNDPKQRPLFAAFDGAFNALLFTGGQIYVASYLVVKHGDFTMGLFVELNTIAIVLSGIFTILAVIAISNKDRKEYFGLAENTVQTKFRDYWPILKRNRSFLMLIISVSSDKLAFGLLRYQVVMVMLFGIVMGDFGLSGTMSAIILIPNVLITIIVVGKSRKTGMKNGLVKSTWVSLLALIALVALFLVIDPTTISFESFGIATLLFIILYALVMGFGGVPSALINPMIADVSDYETYKTGRYIPGMMGTLFSFVDKLITSLPPLIVGAAVSIIGFTDEFPTVNDSVTTPLFFVTMLLAFGTPTIGHIITLIAMKFYSLDYKKMEEVQAGIAEMKEKEQIDSESVN
ncbi:MFS transporter [Virgibacillus ainsalahensis]